MSGIERALANVRRRIEDAASRSGRSASGIRLVAVTKGVPAERIAEAIALGLLEIGENRVQDLRDKQKQLSDAAVKWHLVGTLQRNKVRHVVGTVELIHSVDSAALAHDIGARGRAVGVRQDVLLQVNASGERTKHGVLPTNAHAVAGSIAEIEGVRLLGLMTIAEEGDRQAARATFRLLRELRDTVAIPEARELSMGMSADFTEAIEEGATILRIGSAIFGPRP